MVRKAVRPYSQLVKDFEALDVKDARLRAYYALICRQVTAFACLLFTLHPHILILILHCYKHSHNHQTLTCIAACSAWLRGGPCVGSSSSGACEAVLCCV